MLTLVVENALNIMDQSFVPVKIVSQYTIRQAVSQSAENFRLLLEVSDSCSNVSKDKECSRKKKRRVVNGFEYEEIFFVWKNVKTAVV